jgi:signal transduction protein with GAF and PtsI domain
VAQRGDGSGLDRRDADDPSRRRGRSAAEALAEVARVVSETLDPAVVSQRLTDSLLRLFEAQATTLFRADADSGDFVAVAVSGDIGPTGGRPVVIPRDMGLVGLAAQERGPVATLDALSDPRLTYTTEVRERIERAQPRAVLAVPIIRHDRVIGAIIVADRRGRAFTEDEVWLARAIADHAATLGRIIDEAAQIAGTPHVKVMLVDAATRTLSVGAVQGTSMPRGCRESWRALASPCSCPTRGPIPAT